MLSPQEADQMIRASANQRINTETAIHFLQVFAPLFFSQTILRF
jgi:hypothetical protein